jgi:quinoprotein glucose dehydrogenase
MKPTNPVLWIPICLVGILSCQRPISQTSIVLSPTEAAQKAKQLKETSTIQLADGLSIGLWAADSLSPDPIAMSIDDLGRVFITRTNRQKNSEFDIRGHRDWMTPSIALQSVEDRRSFLRSTFAPEKSNENQWLKDLNGDGSHDWKDLTVEQEEIWRIEDRNGDGLADISTRVFSGLNEEITDVAGALLVRQKDAFLGAGPDMWRLKDKNGDGIYESRESISHGYAVHIGFGGHGMSGLIEGPDGKIYWGIGDIGANLVDKAGKKHEYPNEGVIVRSNPDGSDFEVVAMGLRNTHEFVFDDYGNIITADNDGDHPGESERLVHIIEGCDLGWRANWQYGKYTDPRNNSYKVWMDEKLYKPRWDGQAAYIIPPIMNYHNGPTGMIFNPGTALGKDWLNKFFLVEFVGNPTRSHIWSFGLKPKGASFVLDGEKDLVSGILPTGIKFGPDGALYVNDWVNGWDTKNYGRIWKIDVKSEKNDLSAVRAETKRLIQIDYTKQTDGQLAQLLTYGDMRIRQKAQFELVSRGKNGLAIFGKIINDKSNQLARIHAIWGIGQLAKTDVNTTDMLVNLLTDADAEIVAQAAKVIGDVKYTKAGSALIPLLAHSYPRVKLYAAQALGRLQHQGAVQPLLKMIEINNDEDVYLRHAAVLALSRIGQTEPIVALYNNPNKALRIAAVLVLRRLRDKNISVFLKDADEYVTTEAARAINDDLSITEALPALAEMVEQTKFRSEPLLRRAINACLRVGGPKELDMLIGFAERNDISDVLRAEALATISTWANPSVLDRVDGRYRGVIQRDVTIASAKIKSKIKPFLSSSNPTVLASALKLLAELGIYDYNQDIVNIVTSKPDVRATAIATLASLRYAGIEEIIKFGMEDSDKNVRTTAISLLDKLSISKAALSQIVNPIFEKGSIQEQQQLLKTLGGMPADNTRVVLEELMMKMKDGKLQPDVKLDLIEAVESTKKDDLIAKLEPLRSTGSETATFKETLFGGNRWQGREYFLNNQTAQCVRCHSISGEGGTVGPNLQKIGATLTREQLLQAMIEPSARIAPGYGTVSLTLSDGQEVSGILTRETAEELVLKTSDAEPLKVPVSRIKKRENYPSSMPPMGSIMSKREIRDVVEFLANLK